jgi:hypothetical protein
MSACGDADQKRMETHEERLKDVLPAKHPLNTAAAADVRSEAQQHHQQ